MRFRQLGAPLTLLLTLLVLVPGCAPEDPKLLLLQAREGYQVDLLNWAERSAPAAQPEEAPAAEPEAEPAAEPEAGPEAEPPAPSAEGLLSLRVTRAMTNIELPCLTVDVIYGGENEEEIGRDTLELDLADLSALGGTKEINLVVPLPDAPIAQVAVDLHRIDLDDPKLVSLCEAKAVPELSR